MMIKPALDVVGNNSVSKLWNDAMPASPLSSLIETLIQSIESDARALRERHVLRQALHGLMRQAEVEQAARQRLDGLRLGAPDWIRQECRQQERAYQRGAGIDYPVQ
jgi:hypothetical protein